MIYFVFWVHSQSAEMSYASVAMTCAGPIGGGQCPSKHYVKAKSKYAPNLWLKDKDKDKGGNVVWRHMLCHYARVQRTPSDSSSSPAVPSSPMCALCSVVVFLCPVLF